MNVWVLDNGAYTAKFGLSTDKDPKLIPNCVIKAKNVRNRIFIGDQIDDCKDLSGLYYLLPFQKGYLVNWELEKQVWDHMFGKEGVKVNARDSGIVITEPCYNFQSIQEAINEVMFEEYQFQSLYRSKACDLSLYQYRREQPEKVLCCLLVDTGYSFTHIIPYCNNKPVKQYIMRMNVGGKVLTNHLKEIISYRQLMVMDETYVMNQCKEDVCYVSTRFWKDMEIARKKGRDNTVARDYVLPDYTQVKRGYIRPVDETTGKAQGSEQIIRMNNERFSVPEVLFHPADIGIQEMGVAEAIVYTINKTPEEMRPHFFKNIIVTGGNCMLPGFKERLFNEVRSMAPDFYDVIINVPEKPLTYTWQGGATLAKSGDFEKKSVTRQQYEEHGQNICQDAFDV